MANTKNTPKTQTQGNKQAQGQTAPAAAPAQEMPPVHLDVRVRPIAPQGNLMGYANININGCLAIDGIKVVTGKNGLFASMPSTKDGNGQYKDVCFPVTAEFRQQLHQAVVAEYQHSLQQMQEAAQLAQQQAQQQTHAEPSMAM